MNLEGIHQKIPGVISEGGVSLNRKAGPIPCLVRLSMLSTRPISGISPPRIGAWLTNHAIVDFAGSFNCRFFRLNCPSGTEGFPSASCQLR